MENKLTYTSRAELRLDYRSCSASSSDSLPSLAIPNETMYVWTRGTRSSLFGQPSPWCRCSGASGHCSWAHAQLLVCLSRSACAPDVFFEGIDVNFWHFPPPVSECSQRWRSQSSTWPYSQLPEWTCTSLNFTGRWGQKYLFHLLYMFDARLKWENACQEDSSFEMEGYKAYREKHF